MALIVFIFYALYNTALAAEQFNCSSDGIQLVSWKFHHIENYLTLTVFIIFLILTKVALHFIPKINSFIPESCTLLFIGIAFGLFSRFLQISAVYYLSESVFFYLLLPPIVLHAAYSLHNRIFYENFIPIIMFAVLGTILSFITVGYSLVLVQRTIGFSYAAECLNPKEILLFASIIVAVDPVAVLAIFEQIGVDLVLYYLVFGESLFNDAVTVVLYNIMIVFEGCHDIHPHQFMLGILSFFVVTIGGIVVGIIFGVLCCFLTRIARYEPVLEPLVILIFGYASYLAADLVGWSGMISIICCGLIQGAYAVGNISHKSAIATRKWAQMLSSLSESAIFFFLGQELIRRDHIFDWWLIMWTIALSMFWRAIVVVLLCLLINAVSFRTKIGWTYQFVMIYGGLRGAVAYALCAVLVDVDHATESKRFLLSTTLITVLFYNVIIGISIKPLVDILRIAKSRKVEYSIFNEMNKCILTHTAAAAEDICGHRGRNYFENKINQINDRYIRRILQRNPRIHDEKIVRMYERVSTALHMAQVHPEESSYYLKRLPARLKYLEVKSDSETDELAGEQADLGPDLLHDDRLVIHSERPSLTHVTDLLKRIRHGRVESRLLTNDFEESVDQALRFKHLVLQAYNKSINREAPSVAPFAAEWGRRAGIGTFINRSTTVIKPNTDESEV